MFGWPSKRDLARLVKTPRSDRGFAPFREEGGMNVDAGGGRTLLILDLDET